jgi:hypothetical protein
MVVLATGCSSILGITDPHAGSDGGGPVTLTSIAVSPDPLTLPLGTTRPLTATAMYSDGSKTDVTAQAAWAVDSGSSVTITPAGVATGAMPGGSEVSATLQDVVGRLTIEVASAAPDHVTLSIGDFSIVEEQAAHFHASLVLTDQTVIDATQTAAWATGDTMVATALPGEVDGQLDGTTTLTVSFDQATPATRVVTVRPLLCHPVINEIQSGSVMSPDDEWVEVYNPCTVSSDVDGWTVDYRAASTVGTQDTALLVTMVGSMLPGEIRLFAGPGYPDIADDGWTTGIMQQVNGAIGLRAGAKDVGVLVDSIAYGTVSVGHPFIEGTSCAPLANDKSAARLPFDGNDTDTNVADFTVIATPTPRALNAP